VRAAAPRSPLYRRPALGPDQVSAEIGGSRLGFTLDVLLTASEFPMTAFICFFYANSKNEMIALYDLVYERLSVAPSFAWYQRFLDSVSAPEFRRVLDIGGRARSQIDRRKEFPNKEIIVADIMAGENVDVVCDAHEVAKHFDRGSFDAVQSTSVFEHLLMPWQVILQINKVLRVGGLLYIHTHQTLGLHDMPCDYWRYSIDAWPALLNFRTGFEILEATMSHENYIIPHFWRPDTIGIESSAGFEVSIVVAKKTSDSSLSWDVVPGEISASRYPTNHEPNPFSRHVPA
jgi:SAM-dependent methyltransferase